MEERPFDRLKDCARCLREIDEVNVKLKRIITSGDTYRHADALVNPRFKWEKICTDCAKK